MDTRTGQRPEVAAVLLLVQAGAAVVTVLGLLALSTIEPRVVLDALVTAVFAALLVTIAMGSGGRRRWARAGLLAAELTSLAGTSLAWNFGLAPGGAANLISGILLPIAILALAARRSDWMTS